MPVVTLSERKNTERMDWRATYQKLDNASLLGLLPVLHDRIEQGKRRLEGVANSISQQEKFVKQCEKWLDQAVGLQEHGHDFSDAIEQFEQALHSHAESAPKEQQFQRGLFTYLIDLETRRKWIVEVEAPRRGLLPSLEDFLDDTSAEDRVN